MPASRDDDVYQAKLAEQAERYEGKKRIDFFKKTKTILLINRNG
jgi:hypothetical protein